MTGNDRDFRDGEIRNRFAALRLEEEAQAPEFALPLPEAVSGWRRFRGKLVTATVCLVAILAAGVLLRLVVLKPEPGPGKPVASLTEWRAPTDFLLETPGRELLGTVPAIGVWQNYSKAPRPRQKHQPATKQVLP